MNKILVSTGSGMVRAVPAPGERLGDWQHWAPYAAVATSGYHYRRRGPCKVCGRGAAGEAGQP